MTDTADLNALTLEAAIVEYCGCSTTGVCAAINRDCCICDVSANVNSKGERVAKAISAYLSALTTAATPPSEPTGDRLQGPGPDSAPPTATPSAGGEKDEGCPFCGGSPVLSTYGVSQFVMGCIACDLHLAPEDSEQAAKDRWNRRGLPPVTDEVALGRFKHHPDPAIDFCVEVEEIKSIATDRRLNVQNSDDPGLEARIERAMAFTVGADTGAVTAKNTLRSIDLILKTSATPVPEEVRHTANEWADVATNVFQWLRNVKAGVSTVDESIAAMEKDISSVRVIPTPRAEAGTGTEAARDKARHWLNAADRAKADGLSYSQDIYDVCSALLRTSDGWNRDMSKAPRDGKNILWFYPPINYGIRRSGLSAFVSADGPHYGAREATAFYVYPAPPPPEAGHEG